MCSMHRQNSAAQMEEKKKGKMKKREEEKKRHCYADATTEVMRIKYFKILQADNPGFIYLRVLPTLLRINPLPWLRSNF